MVPKLRFLPEQLGLDLFISEPVNPSYDPNTGVRSDLWRPWVCRGCRCANERRDWLGFICEGCGKVDRPERKRTTAAVLSTFSGHRPSGAGPYPDRGNPEWAPDVKTTEFGDPVDCIEYLFPGLSIHHLTTSPDSDAKAADGFLVALQAQGEDEVPFSRQYLSATSSLATELHLSSFYTLGCGRRAPPILAHFPTSQPLSWDDCPSALLDHVDRHVCVSSLRAFLVSGH